MKDPKDYYLTTAITYTSGKPHIGNTYEIILSDALVRNKKQQGYNVYFQTGTDEHGQKIEIKSKEAGMEPQAFVDEKAGEVKRIWDLMDTTYDKFMRTTDPYHVEQVQKLLGHVKIETTMHYAMVNQNNVKISHRRFIA